MQDSVIIIGCGYIGRRVAALELARGAKVIGVVRSGASATALTAAGIEPWLADLDDPVALTSFPLAGRRCYYFAPPPSRGETDPRMEAVVAMMAPPNAPARVVLISTTGVYGDCRGEWVTEEWPPQPQAPRARRRLAAELALRRYGQTAGVPIVILRVPGIYGPGKLPEKRLRSGEPVLREEEAPYSNRVHADDLAQACLAAAERGRPGAVYNISDGHPTTMTDYFYQVADALHLPRPPAITLAQAAQQLSDGMLSYLAESKRLDNRRMIEELGVVPRYPDLQSGLRTACQSQDQTGG